ncbi:hypothetical protein LW139_18650 [Proteus vulgaris]|uniref:hypothetical protein n=1 Tax=Proteus vulgaris TaxID=585 RepID=UPI001FFEC4C3|nr:hypothetical protein [Proteus vulgaris]UPK80781.1 hypothetical protein LW139_18650 [Proteus vulgaris]
MNIIDSVRTSFSQIKATIDNLDLKNKITDFFYYFSSSITGLFNNNVEYRYPVVVRHICNSIFNDPNYSTYEMLRESFLNIQNEKKLAINNKFNKDEPKYEEVNNIFIDNGVRDKKTSDTVTQSEEKKEHIYDKKDFKRKGSYLDEIMNQTIDEIKTNFSSIK